ncbi:DnaA/Hda family protein [Desulfovibrio sp. ZJ200]|uniref:helix-turn-helix domain-containing protein n=1 Tax=Desulfovibrio sp. ZJ200 TaxID=2709792 RepID=UPI0013EBD767|nr:DnaA/Hda family protein [Desulfovibrio sp. ZJ200]
MLKNLLRDILTPDKNREPEDWFECLILREEENRLRVVFPHVFFAAWFARHKRAMFEEAVRRHFAGKPLPEIVYEQAFCKTGCGNPAEAAPPALPRFGGQAQGQTACDGFRPSGPQTTEKQDFSTFICNGKNAFPLAVAREIAEKKAGEAYNPFLLCGRSGTGKTHLLQTLAAAFEQKTKPGRVICRSAARFCAENPQWTRCPEVFWQQCDVLLLDDMQDLIGQTLWQQKMIACMDACPGATTAEPGRQMAFAFAGSAQALKALDERLRSRLESGLVVELMEPDLEVRLRYLQTLCRQRHLSFSREQLLFLAQRCAQFRLLQGLLLKVEAFAAMHGRPLTPADLENILRTGGAERLPGCREILAEVARGLNLRPEDILGAKRRPDLVLARQVAMYVCRQKLGLSYPELGRAFGGRDHSTVIHAIKKIKKLLISDKDVQRLVTELEIKTV